MCKNNEELREFAKGMANLQPRRAIYALHKLAYQMPEKAKKLFWAFDAQFGRINDPSIKDEKILVARLLGAK